jgi:hypothetical protein
VNDEKRAVDEPEIQFHGEVSVLTDEQKDTAKVTEIEGPNGEKMDVIVINKTGVVVHPDSPCPDEDLEDKAEDIADEVVDEIEKDVEEDLKPEEPESESSESEVEEPEEPAPKEPEPLEPEPKEPEPKEPEPKEPEPVEPEPKEPEPVEPEPVEPESEEEEPEKPAPKPVKPKVEVYKTTVETLGADPFALTTLVQRANGKPVVLDFQYDECGHCQEIAPEYE